MTLGLRTRRSIGHTESQQNAIQEKLTELAKGKTVAYWTAFEKEKGLTDQALKLAEIGKPKSNWECRGYWD